MSDLIPAKPFSRAQLKTRFVACIAVVVAAFSLLGMRLVYLQVIKGAEYRYQSENNRIRIERIPAPRGVIFDADKEILADTFAAFDAQVIPAELPENARDNLYFTVSRLLGLTPEEIEKAVRARGIPKWRPRVIKRHITREEMAMIEARRIELPGFIVTPNAIRTYPLGPVLGNTLGYMGAMTEEELELPQYEGYDPSDYVGRAGIEKSWEAKLKGTPGGVQVQVDVVGRKYGQLDTIPSTQGNNLVLSIIRSVQEAAEKGLGEEAGSVVAIEVGSGRILALASRPNYDPNTLAGGVNAKDWAELVQNERHPLQNRTVQGTYAPGSTFKIVMALAGLKKGLITPSTTVSCSGAYQFGGRRFRCWKSSGHGGVNLEAAIAQSCDVYFYKLGVDLGVDAIHEAATALGLGRPTGIELPGEKSGLIPSSEWKKKARKEPWYPGETLSVSIGQGYVNTTPIQLAVMIAAVADPSGRVMRPTIVDRVESPDGQYVEITQPQEVSRLPYSLSHLQMVREGLRQVVAAGTARSAKLPNWTVAGKTGTSQVVGMKEGETSAMSAAKAWKYRDHALFVSYAPYDDPKIAVAVVVDHGGHGGSAAAPVAAKVIKAYRDYLYPPPPELNPLGDETSDEFVGPLEVDEEELSPDPEEGD